MAQLPFPGFESIPGDRRAQFSDNLWHQWPLSCRGPPGHRATVLMNYLPCLVIQKEEVNFGAFHWLEREQCARLGHLPFLHLRAIPSSSLPPCGFKAGAALKANSPNLGAVLRPWGPGQPAGVPPFAPVTWVPGVWCRSLSIPSHASGCAESGTCLGTQHHPPCLAPLSSSFSVLPVDTCVPPLACWL